MEFPTRPDSHISETASWKILQNSVPAEWIIREVTERDYGVDCYVEIVENHQVTGKLCSLQIKSSERIEWSKEKEEIKGHRARFSGISKATVNYWMNLPVPVFLMWAEIATGKLYFAPVKEQVRRQYSKYLDPEQKTLGFDFYTNLEIGAAAGQVAFFAFYMLERLFPDFAHHLIGFLVHWREYYDFITGNQNADGFLEVEEEKQLLMIHIYRSCKFLSEFLWVEWKVVDLAEAYKQDKEMWKDRFSPLHEMTLARILRELEPVFIQVLDGAKELISGHQREYWMNKNWLLHAICLNLDVNQIKAQSKEDPRPATG